MPTGSLDAEGHLVITPRPEDVGSYSFSVIATDGTAVVSQDVQVNVVPPSNPLLTRIEGTISKTRMKILSAACRSSWTKKRC